MAKSKKKETDKNRVEKLAQRAGKVAAQAERIARDAVDKAVQASTMMIEVLGHPGQAADAVGTAVTKARRTAGDLGTGAQGLLESGTTAIARSEPMERFSSLLDERLRATIASLGLATREEVNALKARIAELEAEPKALPPARRTSTRKTTKAAAKTASAKTAPKAAAKKTAPKKSAAKKAAPRARKLRAKTAPAAS